MTSFDLSISIQSIIKGMSKSKLWKEQTGWGSGTAFNNNKKKNIIAYRYKK